MLIPVMNAHAPFYLPFSPLMYAKQQRAQLFVRVPCLIIGKEDQR